MNNPFRVIVKQSGLSVAQIARDTGMGEDTIRRICAYTMPRNVKLSSLVKLADYLGYRVEVSLIGRKPE